MSSAFRVLAEAALTGEVVRRLDALGRLAERLGLPLALVGGMVRDVLLGRATRDIDLVTSGDPAGFLHALPQAVGEISVTTSRLLTHHLDLADGGRVELARARRETYARAAALPLVAPAGLEDDLQRRDFTVNALAVPLGATWGRVIDLHGGRADLHAGRLRTLHPGSFVDDPTRILRGIELAVRLGFRWAEATAEEARTALERGTLDGLSSARWRAAWGRSFGRLLRRDAAALVAGLEAAVSLGLDRALGADFSLPAVAAVGRLVTATPSSEVGEMQAGLRLLRWLAASDGELAARWARRCELGPEAVAAWRSFPARAASLLDAFPAGAAWRPSRLDAELAGLDAEERALLAADPGGRFDGILARHRDVVGFALSLRGADLVARGFTPGPAIGRVLAEVRRRRLDGELTAGDELEYACRRLEADRG